MPEFIDCEDIAEDEQDNAWIDELMEAVRALPTDGKTKQFVRPLDCQYRRCSVSTGICGHLTFGSGRLSRNGYWERECEPCRLAYISQFGTTDTEGPEFAERMAADRAAHSAYIRSPQDWAV